MGRPTEMTDDEFIAPFERGQVELQKKPPKIQEFDGHGRGYWYLEGLDTKGGSSEPRTLAERIDNENRQPATKDKANLLSSLCFDGKHRPVIDFDFDAKLVPSTSPGHHHLYINKALTWEQFERLLTVMAEVGLVEPGYANAAKCRQATFVRPEWVKKKPESK